MRQITLRACPKRGPPQWGAALLRGRRLERRLEVPRAYDRVKWPELGLPSLHGEQKLGNPSH